jgi:hypothetical protein
MRELILSFVPDADQRLWRTVTRKKYQLRCERVRLQNQLEALLEEAHIKLSSLVTDLLGVSARRMLKALAGGETSPEALAAGTASWARTNHRGHCSSTVSPNLADPAPGSSIRRTGPSGHQTIEAKAHGQNAPAAPQPRLSDRTTQPSTQPSTSAVIFEPVH